MLSELRQNRSPECISDLVFDEWRVGELAADDIRRLEAHIASCDVCSARKESLELLARRFLEEAPWLQGVLSPAVDASRAATPPRRGDKRRVRSWVWAGAALSAAAAAVFVLVLGVGHPSDHELRVKGGPHVGFYVKHGEHVTQGLDGQSVRPGDLLRFVVTTDRPRTLAVLSLDSRGSVTVFSPPRLATETIGPALAQPLETSVELDDSPGTERVYAVFCDGPIDVQRLVSTLGERRELAPMAGCVYDRLHLVKEAP